LVDRYREAYRRVSQSRIWTARFTSGDDGKSFRGLLATKASRAVPGQVGVDAARLVGQTWAMGVESAFARLFRGPVTGYMTRSRIW
jgi:hypothetical protein